MQYYHINVPPGTGLEICAPLYCTAESPVLKLYLRLRASVNWM